MALNSMLVPLLILLPPFYSIEVGLDIATIGTVFMLARIWDALTDTAIGVLSDRTRTRWGRRKPWLVAALHTYCCLVFAESAGKFWLRLARLVLVFLLLVLVCNVYPLPIVGCRTFRGLQ